jgi:hypothetical protein
MVHQENIKTNRNVEYHLLELLGHRNQLEMGTHRNIALSFVKTHYFIHLDDDAIFTPETKVGIRVLAHLTYAIVTPIKYAIYFICYTSLAVGFSQATSISS